MMPVTTNRERNSTQLRQAIADWTTILQGLLYGSTAIATISTAFWAITSKLSIWLSIVIILSTIISIVSLTALWRYRRSFQDKSISLGILDSTFEEIIRELPQWPNWRPSLTKEKSLRDRATFVSPDYLHRSLSMHTTEQSAWLRGHRSIVNEVAQLLKSQSVMATGEPGTGKSLIAFLVFARLADNYRQDSREPFPIFVRLNEFSSEVDVSSNAYDFLPSTYRELTARAFKRISRRGGLVYILDGLDEIPVSDGPRAEPFSLPASLKFLLQERCLVTCREAFHSLYVQGYPLAAHLQTQILIRPLGFSAHVEPYVRNYVTKQGGSDADIDIVLNAIRQSEPLRELMTRALLMRMSAHVLWVNCKILGGNLTASVALQGSDHLSAFVYESYIQDWLVREQGREASGGLLWVQKREIMEAAAFAVFKATSDHGRAYSAFQNGDLLISRNQLEQVLESWVNDRGLPPKGSDFWGQTTREVTERSFLLIDHVGGQRYRFAHKSFYEYLTARYVVSMLSLDQMDEGSLVILLGTPFPDEVIDFLREVLHLARSREGNGFAPLEIEANLLRVARISHATPRQLMARQQAANLVPIVASQRSELELRDLVADSAVHPFIRRAIAVGVALHRDDGELLDALVREMDEDVRSKDFHMGYNLIYYGDAAAGPDGDIADRGLTECSRFFRASIRHVTSVRYAPLMSMALASIQYMLEDSGRREFLIQSDPDSIELARDAVREIAHERLSEEGARRAKVVSSLLDIAEPGEFSEPKTGGSAS